jgi:hypothetical protein
MLKIEKMTDIYEGFPSHGLSEAQQGREFFSAPIRPLIRRRGAPEMGRRHLSLFYQRKNSSYLI